MTRFPPFVSGLVLCFLGYFPNFCQATEAKVDFTNEVQPILADTCFACHGPDEESRQADLRLDIPAEAQAVIELGDPNASELYLRMLETDPDLVMPPPESGKSLSKEQKATIARWIEQGAEYESHWAFTAPQRPLPPQTKHGDWVKNPIDAFVAKRIEASDLNPSETAAPAKLIRRLSLDITGLPLEPSEVAHWTRQLERDGDQAYQKLVSRLLQSSHYGERWGRVWLDAARYADSDGYEKDKPREAWFYRDWVIHSLNQDRPYDDFIIRQIAGDLLPAATQDDRVATGFLRNSMVNEEGGADPEQFRMEAMFDRMDAIGKSVLGLTIQCAQCHTHKYDPIQHDEYYGMLAFLNSTHDGIVPVFTASEQQQRESVLQQIRALEDSIKSKLPDWKDQLHQWAQSRASIDSPLWTPLQFEFLDSTISGSKFLPQADGSYLCQSYAPTNFKPQGTADFAGDRLTALRLDLLRHPNLPRFGPGRSVDGTWALSEFSAELFLSAEPTKAIPLKFARAAADRSPETAPLKARYDNRKGAKRTTGGIEFAIDGDENTAWSNEVDSPLANIDQVAWFELESPIEIPEGQTATIVVHLSQRHGGKNSDDNQTNAIGRFRISATGDVLPKRDPLPPAVQSVVNQLPRHWSPEQTQIAFAHWRTTLSSTDEDLAEINSQIKATWKQHPAGTTQLTLIQCEQPRVTSLLRRGDFLNPDHEVQPMTPAFLHPMKPSNEPPRLQFARWLVDENSPTTARSIVNRIWQGYFGIGLVETSDDLGTQSSPPSHPDLLDYLAVELMESGWSLKHLHRLIVSSATYRQSSRATPEQLEKDPYNRLLARGARFRVPAETVRDITLSASGLLNPAVGGRSVYPPAPGFLFEPPVSYGPKVWNEELGEARYRRALYTFRFRSVPYPMLENFDAVPGNLSCVRRSLSNTPMQALTSLNEPIFLECSVALAKKTLQELPDAGEAMRIAFAFQRCVGRKPTTVEQQVLSDYLNQQRRRIQSGDLNANEILASGKPLDLTGMDEQALASWTLVCRVLLNLDETITRE